VTLTIQRTIMDAIVAHAQAEHPYVACGIVAGPLDLDRPERFVPVRNAQRSTTSFMFDPTVQVRVWLEMDERDEEPVVIYFSHTATDAYPSRNEVDLALEPAAHYVIVSTRDPRAPQTRSFRITAGQAVEEPIHLLPE
jgi:proteasome lid subunit RPN8/RPN11